jgi:hypothetical protein
VTFKDLQKLVQSQSGPEQNQLLLRLRDKPFWIWDPKQHKTEDIKTKDSCCFNHIVGLPRKEGIEKPMVFRKFAEITNLSGLASLLTNCAKDKYTRNHLEICLRTIKSIATGKYS